MAWASSGALLIAAAAALAVISRRFGYDTAVRDMPVLWFVGGFVTCGTAYLALSAIIRATLRAARPIAPLLLLMLAGGLVARAVLFASEPVLNSALMPALQWLAAAGLSALGLTSLDAGLAVRAVLACGLVGLALWLARAPLRLAVCATAERRVARRAMSPSLAYRQAEAPQLSGFGSRFCSSCVFCCCSCTGCCCIVVCMTAAGGTAGA